MRGRCVPNLKDDLTRVHAFVPLLRVEEAKGLAELDHSSFSFVPYGLSFIDLADAQLIND